MNRNTRMEREHYHIKVMYHFCFQSTLDEWENYPKVLSSYQLKLYHRERKLRGNLYKTAISMEFPITNSA